MSSDIALTALDLVKSKPTMLLKDREHIREGWSQESALVFMLFTFGIYNPFPENSFHDWAVCRGFHYIEIQQYA